MANQLYQQMSNNGNDLISQFNKFKNNFSGNAQEQVQQLLNSGRISQAQYNNAVRMAQQFQKLLSGR
jgi:hypothetical protein